MAIVYKHIRLDNNEVFYIGIGNDISRAYSNASRNEYWHNIVNKTEYNVEILYEDISRDDAISIEIELINQYGRIYIDENGTLVNMTTGGDGGDTTTNSPNRLEIINKRSESLKEFYKNKDNDYKKSKVAKPIKARRDWYNSLTDIEKEEYYNKISKTKEENVKKYGRSDKWVKASIENGKRGSDLFKSQEHRDLVSKYMKEHQSGKKFTDEHKKNIGKSSKGRVIKETRKPVIINGIKYPALSVASRELSIPINTIRYRLKSDNFKDWQYKQS